jgi:hypothetical protein
MWLLIGDVRDLSCDVIARTPEAGMKLLALGGWECVCFDHDLGTEKSGYDVLVWAIEHDFMPGHVQLVTSNPVGREKMQTVLRICGFRSTDGINWYVA